MRYVGTGFYRLYIYMTCFCCFASIILPSFQGRLFVVFFLIFAVFVFFLWFCCLFHFWYLLSCGVPCSEEKTIKEYENDTGLRGQGAEMYAKRCHIFLMVLAVGLLIF
jgi:hypothetical protein